MGFPGTSGDLRMCKFNCEHWNPLTQITRSIVLLAVSGKVNTLHGQDRAMLSFIHDYLESRVSLLRRIKVWVLIYCVVIY
jgi:hypothetical protein